MEQINLKPGDKAPLFSLKDQNDNLIGLDKLIGERNIVLAFHPLAWTPVCAQQMKDLESQFHFFKRHKTVALGLSVDSSACKKAWADSLDIMNTSLLCDFWPHGEVARTYGIFIEKFGFSERAVFIISIKGEITFSRIYPIRQVPDIHEIVGEIKKIT